MWQTGCGATNIFSGKPTYSTVDIKWGQTGLGWGGVRLNLEWAVWTISGWSNAENSAKTAIRTTAIIKLRWSQLSISIFNHMPIIMICLAM